MTLSWQTTSPTTGSEVGAVGGGGLSLLTGFRGDGSVVIERPCLP